MCSSNLAAFEAGIPAMVAIVLINATECDCIRVFKDYILYSLDQTIIYWAVVFAVGLVIFSFIFYQ